MRFDNILVTTDFSDDSMAALDIAAYQAKMDGSKVTLLTVIEDWVVPDALLSEVPNSGLIESYRKELQQKAETKLALIASNKFHNQEVNCHVQLSTKASGDEICDFAITHGINLIIIASHGRGGIKKTFLGSVVERVLRHAPCPILVIPKQH